MIVLIANMGIIAQIVGIGGSGLGGKVGGCWHRGSCGIGIGSAGIGGGCKDQGGLLLGIINYHSHDYDKHDDYG